MRVRDGVVALLLVRVLVGVALDDLVVVPVLLALLEFPADLTDLPPRLEAVVRGLVRVRSVLLA